MKDFCKVENMTAPLTKQESINKDQQESIDSQQSELGLIFREMRDIRAAIDVLRIESKEDKSFAAFTISIVLVLIMAGILSMSLIAIFIRSNELW